MVIKQKKITWWEPRWAYLPRVYASYRRAYTFWPLLRVILLTVVIVAIAAPLLQRAFPELEFDWTKATLASIGAGLFILAVAGLVALVPPHISVRQKGIWIEYAGGAVFLKRENVHDICFEVNALGRWLLTFNGPRAEYAIGIPDEQAVAAIADIIEKFWKADVRIVSSDAMSGTVIAR